MAEKPSPRRPREPVVRLTSRGNSLAYLSLGSCLRLNDVRYPEIRVRTESENPFALVAAVREELRLARVESREIDLFSEQALSQAREDAIREVCRAWVNVGD